MDRSAHPSDEKPVRIHDPSAIEAARLRDGVCLAGLLLKDGCTTGFDAHHIDTRGAGGNDVLSNLICLCRKHHNAAHEGRISKGTLRAALKRFFSYVYATSDLEEP